VTDGFAVDGDQLRAHAGAIDAIQQRFAAVKGASAAITQDSAAYGILCAWMSAILEQRHRSHDDLYTYLEENLRLAGDALIQTAQAYDQADETAAERIRKAGGR
jgi:hypothetical protein